MSPHRALSALATVLLVLAAVVPVTRAKSITGGHIGGQLAAPKNVTIAIPLEFNSKLGGTYLKGANASQFTLWSSPKVSAPLRQAISGEPVTCNGFILASLPCDSSIIQAAEDMRLNNTSVSMVVCRAAKTLVYLVSLPYSGVSQLCVVLPTTTTVTLDGFFTDGTYSDAKVSERFYIFRFG